MEGMDSACLKASAPACSQVLSLKASDPRVVNMVDVERSEKSTSYFIIISVVWANLCILMSEVVFLYGLTKIYKEKCLIFIFYKERKYRFLKKGF